MRQLLEVKADQPADGLQAQGIAAIISSEEDDWCVGLEPVAARVLAERLLELAAAHESRFGRAVRQ